MRKILALILAFSMSFGYEKSGFFIGIQASKTSYKVTEKTDTAHSFALANAQTTGSLGNISCETSSRGGIAGLLNGKKTTCVPASTNIQIDGNLAIDLFIDSVTSVFEGQGKNYGGIIGYKKLFAEEMVHDEFHDFTLPVYRFGFRVYLMYDLGSIPTDNATYNTQNFNVNFDALYNFFPNIENFDAGVFVGFSLGYTNYDMKFYDVKGLDYGLNAGLRFTFFKKHNLEFFGRLALNKLDYTFQNDAAANSSSSGYTNPNNFCMTLWGQTYCVANTGQANSTTQLTTSTITHMFQEFEKPYQIGIRYTYTF